jgi:hypothetical protein
MERRRRRKKEFNPKFKLVHRILLGLTTVLSLVNLNFSLKIYLKIQQFIESTFIDSNDLNRMIICGSNTLVVAIEESIYCIIISAIAALITSRLKNRIAIAKWIMLLNLLALLFAVATLYFAYSMQEKYLFALHFSRLIS